MIEQESRIPLFPPDSLVNNQGHLVIGGCDTVALAREFGTPLYLYDELTLRRQCAGYNSEFQQRYPDTTVIYAGKAFINRAMATLLNEEGLGLDVVSAGELGIARSAGFPMDKIYFHGNNKSVEELKLALDLKVGRIVVDNIQELETLDRLAQEKNRLADILLRLTPGVDPHTHSHIITGNIDSKFGFPLADAGEAVAKAISSVNLKLHGLHFHIGSQIDEIEPYQQAIGIILDFAAKMAEKYGFELKELSTGGGFAVQYNLESPAPPVSFFAEALVSEMTAGCRRHGLTQPKLIIEPGRSIVARAGVAIYTAGTVKDIPGVRCYVAVDGGMGDNIRPALYQAKQEAVLANRMRDKGTKIVTIAGKFCESGDILIKDIELPPVVPGDIVAIPVCGAYSIPMSSNYNAFFKPPIVMVREGQARLIRRRETLDDLTRCDLDYDE